MLSSFLAIQFKGNPSQNEKLFTNTMLLDWWWLLSTLEEACNYEKLPYLGNVKFQNTILRWCVWWILTALDRTCCEITVNADVLSLASYVWKIIESETRSLKKIQENIITPGRVIQKFQSYHNNFFFKY